MFSIFLVAASIEYPLLISSLNLSVGDFFISFVSFEKIVSIVVPRACKSVVNFFINGLVSKASPILLIQSTNPVPTFVIKGSTKLHNNSNAAANPLIRSEAILTAPLKLFSTLPAMSANMSSIVA